MLRLAVRNLLQNKVRLLIAAGGVALALMLMLALDAVFTGAETQITAYIDKSGADVWVAQRGVRNLHMVSSWLPPQVVAQVQTVPGVRSATPILYVTGQLELGAQRSLAYIIGLPAHAQAGQPLRIVEGTALPGPGEAVIDRGVAAQAGLRLGDTVKILGRELKISGLSAGTTSITNSVAFISMADFERMRGGAQAVSFVLVRVEPEAAPATVASRIEGQVSGVTAQSTAAFAAQERSLVKDMAGDVLTIMNLVGFASGLAVMALTVYTATLARRSEYGVLKALGARNPYLYRVVLAQALGSVAIGFALAVAFTLLLGAALSGLGSNVALQVSGGSLLKVGVASLIIAGLAALLPIRQIAGLDPASVFRRRLS